MRRSLFEVVASDGVSPAPGASVQFSSSPAVAFSACGGASSAQFSLTRAVWLRRLSQCSRPGSHTAQLAPASYPRPQQVQTTVLGVSSSLDLSLPAPSLWIAQGTTLSVPFTARVLSNGNPVSGATVNYQIAQGTGSLSSPITHTNASGYAS